MVGYITDSLENYFYTYAIEHYERLWEDRDYEAMNHFKHNSLCGPVWLRTYFYQEMEDIFEINGNLLMAMLNSVDFNDLHKELVKDITEIDENNREDKSIDSSLVKSIDTRFREMII
jgi:hypothetical protein